jgi:hypothetical protein
MTEVVERILVRVRLQAASSAEDPSRTGLHAPAGVSFLALTGSLTAVFLTMLFAAMMATTTRATARDLDRLRGDLSRLKTQHRHLVVERALLRDPLRLRTIAGQQGLVAPERVVHIHTGVLDSATSTAPATTPPPAGAPL